MLDRVVLFICALSLAWGCCHCPVSYGPVNNYPINPGASQSTLVSTVTNGKMYSVFVPNDGGNTATNFTLIHVWGDAYEMGYAQGKLLGQTGVSFITRTWGYMEGQIDAFIPWFPTWLQDAIADLGLDAALDFTYYATLTYTPSHFYDELRGIADATGGDYNMLVRVHMIAGLTQGACSMMGAWGKSLDPNGGTGLVQLRALDWDMNGPFRDYAQITVYHPNKGDGHPFINIGMSGFVGGLTGLSSVQLGISEIGVGYPDSSFGSESRIGVPFIFLLREILQYDNSLDDAANRMINARRTCDLILGVGDGKINQFRGFQYSYSVLDIMDDTNMRPDNATWHPKFDDVVYWGMDWDCPSDNTVLSQQIQKYYGEITPETALHYFTSVEKSGDNHLAYYDLTNMKFWVSFAAPFSVSGPAEGYARQFTYFDANALFSETL